MLSGGPSRLPTFGGAATNTLWSHHLSALTAGARLPPAVSPRDEGHSCVASPLSAVQASPATLAPSTSVATVPALPIGQQGHQARLRLALHQSAGTTLIALAQELLRL